MFYRLSKALKKKEGFTLVELMIVVVIIGILVGIAVPVYKNVTQTAERRAVEANLRVIDAAIVMAKADGGTLAEVSDMSTGLTGSFLENYLESFEPVSDETYEVKETDDDNYRAAVSGDIGGKSLSEQTLPISW